LLNCNMRNVLTLLILVSGFCSMSQDIEFRDFRNKKDNFVKISSTQKDIRTDMSSFLMAGIEESISKLPLKTVPVKGYGDNYMTFADDKIQVTIKTADFDQSKHKMLFEEKHLVKIDNKPYYGGTLGEVPRTYIQSITVLMGKDTVAIPPAAYFDLYEPSFFYSDKSASRTRNAVYISNDGRTYYIYMFNPNGKGTEYTWVIQDKKYLRRVVDFEVMQ
jgi:hypothetical protein